MSYRNIIVRNEKHTPDKICQGNPLLRDNAYMHSSSRDEWQRWGPGSLSEEAQGQDIFDESPGQVLADNEKVFGDVFSSFC
jgi:hypothetical protein